MPQNIRIEVSEGKHGLFYGTSPDLKGLLTVGHNEEALYEEIPKTIANLYFVTERYESVRVTTIHQRLYRVQGEF